MRTQNEQGSDAGTDDCLEPVMEGVEEYFFAVTSVGGWDGKCNAKEAG